MSRDGPTRSARRAVGCRLASVALAVLVAASMPWPAGAAVAAPDAGGDTAVAGGAPDAGPTPRFVDAAHRVFLGRPPADAELPDAAFTVHRDGRGALTAALATSPEWAGVEVAALYRDVLGRDSDPDGVAFWLSRIAAGDTVESVAAHFYGSVEFRADAGGTDAAFVDALYRRLLERDADDDGRAHWVDRLRTGALGHDGVAAAFFDSVESRRQRVDRRFREVLGRAPDPAGRVYWVDAIRTIGDVHLAAALAASDEFYVQATGVAPPRIATVAVGPGTPHPLEASWRPGCPVAPTDLVAVEFDHVVLDDDEHRDVTRGVLVVHRDVVHDVETLVGAWYGFDLALRQARPVDDFGGDDDASMAADNTSAFNCRTVAGTTAWSRHAFGTAIDVNPVENPFVHDGRVDPAAGAAHTDRTDVGPGMLVEGDPVVATVDRLGWGWGGRWSSPDFHHLSQDGR